MGKDDRIMDNNIIDFYLKILDQDKTSEILLARVMDEWLRNTKNYIKISTYQKYKSIVVNHINRNIGNIAVCNLNDEIISSFISFLLSKGNINDNSKLSTKTVNDILVVLEMGLSYGKEKYRISYPPIKLLKNKYKETKILTIKEQKRLENYLLYDMDIFKFGILLTLYTGLRIGELCALQWGDIVQGNIRVSKTMLRIKDSDGKTKIIITDPKTPSSNRTIPLPDFILPIVQQFRKSRGYVISNKNGKFIEPRLMQIKFKKIITDAKIDDINFHGLRHSFATRCVEADFEIKSLSEILGHANIKTTLNLYVHSSFELKQQNMNKLKLSITI